MPPCSLVHCPEGEEAAFIDQRAVAARKNTKKWIILSTDVAQDGHFKPSRSSTKQVNILITATKFIPAAVWILGIHEVTALLDLEPLGVRNREHSAATAVGRHAVSAVRVLGLDEGRCQRVERPAAVGARAVSSKQFLFYDCFQAYLLTSNLGTNPKGLCQDIDLPCAGGGCLDRSRRRRPPEECHAAVHLLYFHVGNPSCRFEMQRVPRRALY